VDFVEEHHDLLMGVALMISAGLTFASTRTPAPRIRKLALLGAAVTFVIGALLALGLA
jgi:hypothetical protein